MWIIIGCFLANVFCDAVAHQAEGTKICKKSEAIIHHQRKKITRKSCMLLHSFATTEEIYPTSSCCCWTFVRSFTDSAKEQRIKFFGGEILELKTGLIHCPSKHHNYTFLAVLIRKWPTGKEFIKKVVAFLS